MRKSRQPRCSATISSDAVGKIREAAGPHSKLVRAIFSRGVADRDHSRIETRRMAFV
jgi:hypothetical protein